MLPDGGLSGTPVYGPFLDPDNRAIDPLVGYSMGGTAVGNAGSGMNVQVWTLSYSGSKVVLTDAVGNASTLFELSGVTALDLAFDQNMQPFVALATSAGPQFWWYDPQSGTRVFTTLPAGTDPPRCTLDDRRPLGLPVSDIILAYTRSGALYYRAERDRYGTEYTLTTSAPGVLRRVAMNSGLRLQFELGGSIL